MHIRTIEFKDIRTKDFTIIVHNADETDRVETITKPRGMWFHYDISKYTLDEAKRALINSYIELQNEQIIEATSNIVAVLKDN